MTPNNTADYDSLRKRPNSIQIDDACPDTDVRFAASGRRASGGLLSALSADIGR